MTTGPETFSRPRDLPLARGRLLLIGTGAFGVTQLPQWIVALRRWYGVDVRTCVTHSAVRLVAPGALAVASGHAVAGPDWDTSTGRVPHRDLASWPDLVMDTPAPVVVAPSLPEGTSRFPPVVRNLRSLAADGIVVVPTVAGVSLDDGGPTTGAMAGLVDILRHARQAVHAPGSPEDASRERESHE
jgi:phosphopantothenoylcysteine decarboxylase/phosphopantothenate--cysteine ligase